MSLKPHWFVYTSGYVSRKAKIRIEKNPGKSEIDDFQTIKCYSGYSESSAMKAFFQASSDAMTNDLIINVVVERDTETFIEMRADHHPERNA